MKGGVWSTECVLHRLKINLDAGGLVKGGVGSTERVLRRLKVNLDAEGIEAYLDLISVPFEN